MRIVQISTDTLPVPPPKYGGIQRIVHSLTEELVNRGHEVFLYAPKGSTSSATIIPYEHKGPNNHAIIDFVKKTLPPNIDLIHDHTHFSVIDKNIAIPTISTIHINNSSFPRYPVYISEKARKEVGNDQGFCIYNGIDLSEYEYSEEKSDYLLFLGEVTPKKGAHHALEIAEKTNLKLIIAGPVYDREFFAKEVEPRIKDNCNIEYIGEVGGKEKQTLLKHAKCLLFPIEWREPFGLVMIEAMACGTPVLAFQNGSVREILSEFPDFICKNVDEMVTKIQQPFPSSKLLRDYVEKNFSSKKMVDSYIELYEKIVYEKIPCIHKPTKSINENETIFEILQSFSHDIPRAESCCKLGFYFKEKNQLQQAVFWFKLALQLDKPNNIDEFYDDACWTWQPHLQLCVCYYRLGDFQKSYHHNEMARQYIPNDWRILQNKALLEKKLKQNCLLDQNNNLLRPLKIVQVAPDIYPLPPPDYGGIEKIVYELTEELVSLGHEVFLFAPEGTITRAKLIPYQHQGTWKAGKVVEQVKKFLPDFVDIIHEHTHFSSVGKAKLPIPTISTIHLYLNNNVEHPVYVSDRMLQTIGKGQGYFIHNGIKIDEYQYSEEKEEYFLYLGRLGKQKGTSFALDVCERANIHLKMAGPYFNLEEYKSQYEPRIKNNPNIDYLGPVKGQQKQDLLKYAKCLLFPTNWEEAFGLVMIEAMACGTPVLALANGAVSEVLKGFPELVCHSVDEMVEKALTMTFPEPKLLREYVEKHYTTRLMTERYVALYKEIIQQI